jgi:hypothetical protein
MVKTLAGLKRNSKALSEKISDQFKNESQGGFESDPREWYPAADAAGNGSCLIRFLPPCPGDDDEPSFVRLWNHAFKGPTGKWYIENSLTTIGQDDPCSEHNQKLWNTEIESNRKLASLQKRQLNYYTNVYVIKDGQNPENNGTVRLFRFGPTIFEFIKSKITPEFEDIQPVNVFDFWEGANFRIRFRKDEHGYRKYDKSEWDGPSEFMEGDETKIEAIWNQQHSLKAIIAPDKFKSYDDLKKKLNEVLGLNQGAAEEAARPRAETPQPRAEESKPLPTAEAATDTSEDGEDDADLDFFKRIGEAD